MIKQPRVRTGGDCEVAYTDEWLAHSTTASTRDAYAAKRGRVLEKVGQNPDLFSVQFAGDAMRTLVVGCNLQRVGERV